MTAKTRKLTKRIVITAVAGLVAGLLAGVSVLMSGKPVGGSGMGVVTDWTTRHIMFSNPGTATEAMARGQYAKWYRTVNDPRYLMQQMRRHPEVALTTALPESFGSLANRLMRPLDYSLPGIRKPAPKQPPAAHHDWAFSLGAGTVPENQYPSTFSAGTSPSCSDDFAVYGLNVAGVNSGQANLVALNQLYSGSNNTSNYCGKTGPSVYWAYNVTTKTGGKVNTSPVLSLNGNQVIFVESIAGTSGGAILHVLQWVSGQGTSVTGAVAPGQTATSLGACTGGSTSCLVSVNLGSGSAYTNTYSSPWYDYGSDTVYVGDDDGVLYKVTPVLNSTSSNLPALTKLTVNSGNALSGPVYDNNTGNVFVGGSYNLYAVKASTMALQTHGTLQVGDSSSCTTANNVLYFDAPLVDSTNDWVYDWATTGINGTNTVVVQAYTTGTNSPTGTSWTAAKTVDVGSGDSGCNSSGLFPTHAPTFDNNYYEESVTTGHLWVCGTGSSGPELYEIATSGSGGQLGSASSFSSDLDALDHAQCSPISEIYNTAASQDYIFMGEGCTSGGSGCSSALGRIYGFAVSDPTSGTPTATAVGSSPITYPSAAGGTSGIVMDNVYYPFGAWQASFKYTKNTEIVDPNGNIEEVTTCTSTCQSGTSAPSWTKTTGSTTSDNQATWTNEGPAQTSSIYFTTLTSSSSTSYCGNGSTAVYCAVKLTQGGLE